MSTAFNTASDYGDGCWDIILVSSDTVHFYVRICRLLNASTSYFGSLLLPCLSEDSRVVHACINVSEGMYVLDVLLHVIYDIPFQYAPALHILLDAIRALHKYGIPLDLYIVPGKLFFEEIARQTHHDPLEVYAVAAEHNIFPLARRSSGHLLKLPLVFLADDMAARLGLAYLHMLYSLHLARVYHLQRILAKPPQFHEPTTLCGESEYQVLQLTWYNETINLTSQANPGKSFWVIRARGSDEMIHLFSDVSGIDIWNALDRVRSLLTCAECQNIVQRRIDEAISQWSETPVSSSSIYHVYLASKILIHPYFPFRQL